MPGGLRGTLARLPLPDLLHSCGPSGATGILSLTSGGARKALYFKRRAGRLRREQPAQRPPRRGAAPRGQDHPRPERDLGAGARPGAAPGQASSSRWARSPPDELWWAVQTQVREIVFSVFQWDEGQFHFEETVLPRRRRSPSTSTSPGSCWRACGAWTPGARCSARVPRRVPRGGARGRRRPRACWTPTSGTCSPWCDGEKSVVELCHESEAGEGRDPEGLCAFLSTGIVCAPRAGRSGRSTRTSCPRTASSRCSTPSTGCTATSSRTW